MKFKLFVFLFIILFFPACPFMGDPPGPILHRDECSEYGCGDGGECKSFDDSDSKTCICDIGYSLYEFDLSEDDSKSYCIAKPKQLVMGTYLKIVLSNYGYDIPKALDEYNRFLYYSDIAKFYPSYNTINDF